MSQKIQYQSNPICKTDFTRIDKIYIIRYYANSKDRKNNKLISARKMHEIIGSDKTWEKSVMKKINQIWNDDKQDIKLRRGIMFRIAFR
jgi:hypothetical protein